MAVSESAGFKQLVGTARDQVIYFLRRLDKWVPMEEARRRRLIRSYGRRGSLGLWVGDDRIGPYGGEELSREFGADRLVFFGLSRDLRADRLGFSGRSP